MYHTKEYGLKSEYDKIGVARCRPFNRIVIRDDTFVKEPVDDQGCELARREVAWYRKVIDKGFREIPKIYGLEPICMELIDGKNIYEYTELSHKDKRGILERVIACLKQVQEVESIPSDRDSYEEAYIGKTMKRLQKVRALVPFANDPVVTVNGRRCRNVFFYEDELKKKTAVYCPEKFKLIHGDCTFSNIMLRSSGVPVLIDPRGYFGSTELYGDPAYDWVKLYYSIVGNYDQFNLKRFNLCINEKNVELSIESNHWEDMEDDFFQLLAGEVTREQIRLFHAITWLSLTTYAWEDYDSICGAFYNGLYYLEGSL